MGQSMRKLNPFRGSSSENERKTESYAKFAVVPYVFKRRGSQYFDEEGDLAHEFYEQKVDESTRKVRMLKRKSNNLTPQGEVVLKNPRLSCDLPIVLREVQDTYR